VLQGCCLVELIPARGQFGLDFIEHLVQLGIEAVLGDTALHLDDVAVHFTRVPEQMVGDGSELTRLRFADERLGRPTGRPLRTQHEIVEGQVVNLVAELRFEKVHHEGEILRVDDTKRRDQPADFPREFEQQARSARGPLRKRLTLIPLSRPGCRRRTNQLRERRRGMDQPDRAGIVPSTVG
jgi:hypothetical protein